MSASDSWIPRSRLRAARGGKLAVQSTVPLTSREDLSLAYTPGGGPGVRGDRRRPGAGRRLHLGRRTPSRWSPTARPCSGLGNIGPRAAMPVMEGKAVLFKQFGGVDAVPICLDTQDVDEIVAMVTRARALVRRHQPGGHQRPALLRDRAAARRGAAHPGLPRRPARHRDRGAGRAAQRRDPAATASSATCGWWSAGPARPASRCTQHADRRPGSTPASVVVCDSRGVMHAGPRRPAPRPRPSWPRSPTPPGVTGGHRRGAARRGRADRRVRRHDRRGGGGRDGARRRSIFALANPTPEVHPTIAAPVRRGRRHRAQRLPQPDQQRAGVPGGVPGRAGRAGHPDHRADEAGRRRRDRRGGRGRRCAPDAIVPSPLDPRVAPAVAAAVAEAARPRRRRPRLSRRAGLGTARPGRRPGRLS